VNLPPRGCDYLSAGEAHIIIDGLPPGTTINVAPIHGSFLCGGGPYSSEGCEIPPPSASQPSSEIFFSTLVFNLTGTGSLAGLNCTLAIPGVEVEVHLDPRPVGDPDQTLNAEMVSLYGSTAMDMSCNLFQSLTVRAGSFQGLPTTAGMTRLLRRPNGKWQVDSFFDVFYSIQFVGKPGGPLAGRSGTTTATEPVRMTAGSLSPSIPTLSQWGLISFMLVLLGGGALLVLHRRVPDGRARNG